MMHSLIAYFAVQTTHTFLLYIHGGLGRTVNIFHTIKNERRRRQLHLFEHKLYYLSKQRQIAFWI